MFAFIKPIQGLPNFAMLSQVAVFDNCISAPQRRILELLMLFSDKRTGQCHITRATIATTLDFTLRGMPNEDYVSRLISNPNYKKGVNNGQAGLFELGYISNKKQRNFNQPNVYTLSSPEMTPTGLITRPDGSTHQTPFYGLQLREQDAAYKVRKANEKKKSLAAKNLVQIKQDSKNYSYIDVYEALIAYHSGQEFTIPELVLEQFFIDYPNKRDKTAINHYQHQIKAITEECSNVELSEGDD